MCQLPNCKYIELIEDENTGMKTEIHYGLNNNEFYIIWFDRWKPIKNKNKTRKRRKLKLF